MFQLKDLSSLVGDISFSLNTYYKGKFKVHPEQYKCMDGWGDSLLGQLPRTIYPNFVNIISWEKK